MMCFKHLLPYALLLPVPVSQPTLFIPLCILDAVEFDSVIPATMSLCSCVRNQVTNAD